MLRELMVLIARCADRLVALANARQYCNDHVFYRRQFFLNGDAVVISQGFACAFFRAEPPEMECRDRT